MGVADLPVIPCQWGVRIVTAAGWAFLAALVSGSRDGRSGDFGEADHAANPSGRDVLRAAPESPAVPTKQPPGDFDFKDNDVLDFSPCRFATCKSAQGVLLDLCVQTTFRLPLLLRPSRRDRWIDSRLFRRVAWRSNMVIPSEEGRG